MALLPILCYPDPKLHKVAKPVQAVDAQGRALLPTSATGLALRQADGLFEGRLATGVGREQASDYRLQVRDTRTGRDLAWQVPEVSSAAWAADGRTLFYVTMDAAKRSHRLWRAVPGSADAPVLVHEEPDAVYDISVRTTRDQRWLVLPRCRRSSRRSATSRTRSSTNLGFS